MMPWRKILGAFLCGILAGAMMILWVFCQLGVLTVWAKPVILAPVVVDSPPPTARPKPTRTPTPFVHKDLQPGMPESGLVETSPGMVAAQTQ